MATYYEYNFLAIIIILINIVLPTNTNDCYRIFRKQKCFKKNILNLKKTSLIIQLSIFDEIFNKN